jgi:hypothetical protein
MRWRRRRDLNAAELAGRGTVVCPEVGLPDGFEPPSAALAPAARTVVIQAEMERMLGEVAVIVDRLEEQAIYPRAVAIRSGSLHGLEGGTVHGLPVVRLHADSPVEWGVVV